ncbi:helix-turn-helix domain-containing protein [Anabaena sphaerica FACHB-251]|uniref:Helix-turn-helix domain-containing protein n=1 Tax=Anabaena sphaerica FACHB-251 TaxID=2692883 RepID=A0A926WIX0_9NOST|nr:helix-turn-helix transcriptional regulator [Anabaena sphaerica]MBD2295257.1 helix-turn-helix domain-containing protein [Anabaena sphaerica FACHB-251]
MLKITIHLKSLREAKGHTQRSISRLLDMTEDNYARYEQGKIKVIPLDFLDQLCEVLECEVSDILRRE